MKKKQGSKDKEQETGFKLKPFYSCLNKNDLISVMGQACALFLDPCAFYITFAQ